jgi:CheY-like chemotaxis protein
MRNPISIAYVEDSPHDVRALRGLLKDWHVVNPLEVFETGDALLRSLRAGVISPGIVLVDMALPGGFDGLDIIRLLRKDHASTLPNVPLVMVTGTDDENAIQLARMAGADAYIVKPVGIPSLMRAINQAAPFVLEIVRATK